MKSELVITQSKGWFNHNDMTPLQPDPAKWEDRSHLLGLNKVKAIVQAFTGKSASVQVSRFQHLVYGDCIHLWIRRHDNKPMGWTELQRIKNEILGHDAVAVQVFPKQADVIDRANMYHLWQLGPGFGVEESDFKF